ncbi:MAG TPA: RDD family protein [Rugosibacter sp.]|nr:RDD family protein [Rugosibacter sp.]
MAIYESLILVAIWVLGTAVFLSINGVSGSEMSRWSLRIFLWALSGFYFVWCWIKSGQTLAAQTWKVKLVNAQSAPLSLNHAILRYVLATVSLLVFGLGFLWAVFDKDHLFFHDRLLNTHFERRW